MPLKRLLVAGILSLLLAATEVAANPIDDCNQSADLEKQIDGCTEFEIFWRIVMPVCRPALAALGIMQLIGSWNNLMGAFLMLRTADMQTLPVLIYLLQGETRTPFGMLMAGGLLATLPLVIAFIVFQRQFISGMTAGAVK